MRISRRDMLSVTGALAASVALGCEEQSAAPPDEAARDRPRQRPEGASASEDDFAPDHLVDRIGRAREPEARALVAEARAREVEPARLLAAAWVAPLRHGGLPSDVHVVLTLPAIDRLARAATAWGLDPWPSIAWALANTTAWCSDTRAVRASPALAATAASTVQAIRRADPNAAESHARGLAERSGADAALDVLATEALEPREDVHASIYAAQLGRVWPDLAPAHCADAVAHLARYLARVPRVELATAPIETVDGDGSAARDVAAALAGDPRAPLPGVTSTAIFDALAMMVTETRASDPSPSGIGVHRTTHLDAVSFLARRAGVDRARALGCAVASVLRLGSTAPSQQGARAARPLPEHLSDPRAFERGLCRRVIARGSDEHTFKYWAALHALAEVTSPAVRSELWSGSAMLDAVR